MPQVSRRRELAFLLYDVARLLRTLADQRVRALDMTRAQWAVLAALERAEGLKQAELAEILEIRPITLTRLVDRLCAGGLVERRADPDDRRAKRLFLTPAARPLVARLSRLGEDLMQEVLAGIDATSVDFLLKQLSRTKDNLRNALPANGHRVASWPNPR
ncbi:MAG TPA: MarR family transcriptional regulator [Xanthobacteraceae bacterium]|nr:MarR family transcriptional regulator [Xanthobacteraceae bacterium]